VLYRRIHLIGGPGSGKSYLAAKITAAYGITSFALDDLFWDASAATYGVRADPHTRDQALAAIVARDAWVIEGAYYKWLTPSFERADLIIVLNPSVWLRDWRIMKRFAVQRFRQAPSKKKETIPSILSLMQWNHTYEKNQLRPTCAVLARLNKRPVECRTVADALAVLAVSATGSSTAHLVNEQSSL
jgi:adenylate kinase family enzyme